MVYDRKKAMRDKQKMEEKKKRKVGGKVVSLHFTDLTKKWKTHRKARDIVIRH